MLGNEAIEFLKTLHKLDEIWKQHDNAEYNERQLTQFAERYHEYKLKLLGIADVVGRSEHLICSGCGRTESQHNGQGTDICPNNGGRFKAK